MSDRKTQEALMESPSFLLQELGIHSVGLYRWRQADWQWLSTNRLDDDIWEHGEALVFHQLSDGRSAIIRFGHPIAMSLHHRCPGYALVSIRPDYVGDGRKYLVSLRDETLGGQMYRSASVLGRLKRLPLVVETDIVVPWPP